MDTGEKGLDSGGERKINAIYLGRGKGSGNNWKRDIGQLGNTYKNGNIRHSIHTAPTFHT